MLKTEGGYVNEIFARMNVQQYREFVLYGTEDKHTVTGPYHVRLKQGSDPIYSRLQSAYHDNHDQDKVMDELSQALSTHCAVYMEIGMKAGARLVYQLLIENDVANANDGSVTQ